MFLELHSLLIDVIENKEWILGIRINDTNKGRPKHHNIKVGVELNLMKAWWGKCEENKTPEAITHDDLNKIMRLFNYRDIIIECSSFISMVDKSIELRDDIEEVLSLKNVKIHIYYDVLGFSWDDLQTNDIEDIYRKARNADANEMLSYEAIKEIRDKRIEELHDKVYDLKKNQEQIEKYIRVKKRAYVFSKLTEGKIHSSQMSNYEGLTEAYDIYLDIKNALSNKFYV